jgi:hypothetical protein
MSGKKQEDGTPSPAALLAHQRWDRMNKPERSRANEPGRKGVIKMWAGMTEEEKSVVMKRRAVVRTKNQRLRALGLMPPAKK